MTYGDFQAAFGTEAGGILTQEEFEVVRDWLNREKDRLPSPLKEGLLKLLNAEERGRAFGRRVDEEVGGGEG